jgi:hypothetical protein
MADVLTSMMAPDSITICKMSVIGPRHLSSPEGPYSRGHRVLM